MKKHRVFISVGSNIGDKKENCETGLSRIESFCVGEIVTVSGFYKTEPVDYTDQDWFVNAVAEITTSLLPEDLLDALKGIEHELGTVSKNVRFGPRIIDLDILLYDDIVFNSGALIIPHERMHERVFVLKPLCDINADIIHPVFKKDVTNLLLAIEDDDQAVILIE